MKKLILFGLIFILTIFSVTAVSNKWMGSNNVDTVYNHNKGYPIITGSFRDTNFTSIDLGNCGMDYQPLAKDLDEDGETDLILFCGTKIKIYDSSGTLQEEKIIGSLKGSPRIAIKDDFSYNIVAVVNTSQNEGNLTYLDFNGTAITITKTYNASTVGGGTSSFCPTSESVCSALNEGVLQADIGGTEYYCELTADRVLCYDTIYLNNSAYINFTHGLGLFKENKLYVVNWDGGDDNFIVSGGSNGFPYLHYFNYYDSTGSEIWTKTTGNFNYYNSFIDDVLEAVCTASQSSDAGTPFGIACYNHVGTAIYSQTTNANFLPYDGGQGIIYNTLIAYYNDDTLKDLFTPAGIVEYTNDGITILEEYPTEIKNTLIFDLDGDGSLDYIKNTGSNIYLMLSNYTNLPPEIDSLSYSTGNPVCLYSSITFEIDFFDNEDESGKIKIDRYGDGNYTEWGSLSITPSQSVTYNQLGTYTTVIILEDESGNRDNITYGVTVQTSNCYNTGQGGDTTTTATTGETTDIGGFIIKGGDIDGYQRDRSLYDSNNSIYFDESQCIELYGDNWDRMIIPCPVRLMVKQGLNEIKGWVIGSFILVILALIIFIGYLMIKHKK